MRAQLDSLCGQLEQVMIATLVPPSLFGDRQTEDATSSGLAPDLFAQVFAAAFERAGGIGLRAEFVRALGDRK
jgi:hypothetical protein